MTTEKLTLSPDEFHFKAPYTRANTVELCLENKTKDQRIAFKVKTIDPKRYVVKPTNGVLAPGKSMIVKVTMQALPNQAAVEAFLASKQKFMVQWRTFPSTTESTESATTLMAKPGGDPMVENKVTCRFDGPSEQSASYKSVDGAAQGVTGQAESLVAALSNYKSSAGQLVEEATAAIPSNSNLSYFLALVVLLIAMFLAYMYRPEWFGMKR